MSPRDRFPKPREYPTHFSISLARGEQARTFALHPGALFGILSIVPLLALGCLALGLLFVFRDDLLASLMSRQAEMQYAYEDRLAAMRTQIERMKSRELVQEHAYEGRLHELFQRQAQLETRATLVASLAQRAASGSDITGEVARAAQPKPQEPPTAANQANPLLRPRPVAEPPGLPASVSSFAPITSGQGLPTIKPHPDAMELRLAPRHEPIDDLQPAQQQSAIEPLSEPHRDISDTSLEATFPARLAIAESALDRVERRQIETVARLHAPAAAAAGRLRVAIAETGLSSDRLIPPAGAERAVPQGGPFVPVQIGPDSSAFAREFAKVQEAVLATDKLRRIVPYIPIRKPLPGTPDVTSGFGVRIDPFLGRPAMHTGIDLRDDYGAPVRATAGGRVVTAEWTGGYGRMVEIDHGNGIATRYGHLARISVRDGQSVEAGAVVGRIGSSGRATGPHLHYEVRIDDEAVDPARFLRAAQKLAPAD
jgi:murein DD-endopeptidase MepM/ murein hydrolase activator NlpD